MGRKEGRKEGKKEGKEGAFERPVTFERPAWAAATAAKALAVLWPITVAVKSPEFGV